MGKLLKVTIRDVALTAGVSRTSVSLALRKDPRLPPETTQKVLSVATRMGYKPDAMITALMSRVRGARSHKRNITTIGLLTTHHLPLEGQRLASYFIESRRGIEERASQLGYKIDEIPTARLTGTVLSKILRSRGIQAILFFPPLTRGQHFPNFDLGNFTSVSMGYFSSLLPVTHVTLDFHSSARIAIEEATRRGFHRLGLCLAQSLDPGVDYSWSQEFLLHHHLVGRHDQVPFVKFSGPREGLAWRRAVLKWIEKHKPDVIFSHEEALLDMMRNQEISIPSELGFINLSMDSASFCSGVDASNQQIAHAAVDAIVAQIHRNERGIPEYPKRILIQPRWRNGGTLPEIHP